MFTARFFSLASAIALFGSSAQAFVRETNDVGTPGNPMLVPIELNKDHTVLMHLSLPPDTGFIDGSASYNAIAEDALNIWNQYLAHMQFAVDRNSILPPDQTDANTSVIMTTTIYGDAFDSSTLAVTLVTPR